MRLCFFTVPVFDSAASEAELNAFLSAHIVVKVDRELVRHDTMGTVWAICVSYVEAEEASKATSSPNKNRIDYRDVLSEADVAVFARLRSLRKELSDAQRVPAYTLFSHEQLAAMVQSRTTTKASLAEVKGVGAGRVDKYGDAFVELLVEAFGDAQA